MFLTSLAVPLQPLELWDLHRLFSWDMKTGVCFRDTRIESLLAKLVRPRCPFSEEEQQRLGEQRFVQRAEKQPL